MVKNTLNLAVASSIGIEVYDCMKDDGSSLVKFYSLDFEDEMLLIKSFELPTT